MKKLSRLLTFAVVTLALGLGGETVFAQDTAPAPPPGGGPGPGGFGGGQFRGDPAQFQQQMQQRISAAIREKLGVTNDDEWGVIEPKLNKVTQVRMEVTFSAMSGMRGLFGGGNRGGGGAGRFAAMGGAPMPEADALQQALDSNAPKDQVKAALQSLRDAKQRKKDELAKAQDELKQMLTLRQEATLVSLGVLD